MAIDFPSSPTVGQQYTYNGITYTYTAQGVWSGAGGPGGPTGATGSAGTVGSTGPTGMTGAGTPATVAPLMDGVAAVGATVKFAREDHVHPTDTSRVADTGDTVTGVLNIYGAGNPWIGIGNPAGGVGAGFWGYHGDPTIAANLRWGIVLGDGGPETGGNSGSDFALYRCDDAGNTINTPIAITRAAGDTTFRTTTASTSVTTGALTVAGGMGIGGAGYFGGSVYVKPSAGQADLTVGSSGSAQRALVNFADGGTLKWQLFKESTNALYLFDNAAAIIGVAFNSNINVAIGYTTASTNTTTGALTVTGGAGIGGAVFVGGGIVSGTPTGGGKGAGTINAVNVYDDNVLLTCFGTQYAARGTVDLAQWDAVSPTGSNQLARKFVAMLRDFDPRDPKQYIERMLEDEALPGMPTVGEWRHGEASLGEMHNRLWLATELLASAFVGLHNDYETRLDKLTKRVEALEKGTT